MYLGIPITTKARKIGGQLNEQNRCSRSGQVMNIDTHSIYLYVNPFQFIPTFVSVANQEALRHSICMSFVVNLIV